MIPGSLLNHCKDGLLSLLGSANREQEQQDRTVVTLNRTAVPSEAEKAKALKRLARSQRLMAKVRSPFIHSVVSICHGPFYSLKSKP